MNDHLALLAVDHMAFLPSEVVVVFDVEDDARAELFPNVLVDELMVRGGITSHQVHGVPVFLPILLIEREPCQVLEFLR